MLQFIHFNFILPIFNSLLHLSLLKNKGHPESPEFQGVAPDIFAVLLGPREVLYAKSLYKRGMVSSLFVL